MVTCASKGTISVGTSKVWINLGRDVIYFVEYRETLDVFGGRLIGKRTPSAFFTWLEQLSKDCYRQRVLENYCQRHNCVLRPETSERLREYNLERGCTKMIRHVAFKMQALVHVVTLNFCHIEFLMTDSILCSLMAVKIISRHMRSINLYRQQRDLCHAHRTTR